MTEKPHILLTQEELRERLAYWQERLRLQDWIIEVNIRRGRDMRVDCSASVNWGLGEKKASISILDQTDLPEDVMGVREMEHDLVHELLHLHLAPIHDHFGDQHGDFYMTFEEQAIESIADGLIVLERKGQDDGTDI